MPATAESRARTRAFARVIGPFFGIVSCILAVRIGDMGALHFFDDPMMVWLVGALLLFGGLLVIANHQVWSSPAAVVISLFGWFLLLRGIGLLAVPQAMNTAVSGSMTALPAVRAMFLVFAAVGAWLSWVGWAPRRTAGEEARDGT